MTAVWSVVFLLAGPPIGPAASPTPAVQPSAGEIAIPIAVIGPGGAVRIGHADVSVVALSREGRVARRGKVVARGTTGPMGEPCVVRLAASPDPLLVEARQQSDEVVFGSMVIVFDRGTLTWKSDPGPRNRSTANERAADDAEQKPTQPTLSVRIPERATARIYPIASRDERLVGDAEILVFTTSGRCIRRGSMRESGDVFDAERDGPLHSAYRRLWVVARAREGNRFVAGSTLVVFNHNNWLPATHYERFTADSTGRSGRWTPESDFDAASGQFAPILQSSVWTPNQIRVMIPVSELPVWNSPPANDAPAGAFSADGAPGPSADAVEIAGELGLRPEPLASSEIEAIAMREAAIVEAGRPLSPDHAWADFGRRWVRGPVGMYWQTAIGEERL